MLIIDALAAGVIHGWFLGDLAAGLRSGVTLAAFALSQSGDMVVTTETKVSQPGKLRSNTLISYYAASSNFPACIVMRHLSNTSRIIRFTYIHLISIMEK